MSLGPSSPSAGSSRSPPPTYDFTKRKRWADILISELPDAITLVLSPVHVVLFCGSGITDLLGWKDVDLIDQNLLDFINPDDHQTFQENFNESVHMRNQMTSYVRLKCKDHQAPNSDFRPPPNDVLFEVLGYPHYIADESHARCFFAVAKPYPSRNTAVLNTFLELKIQNERLLQRLAELRVRANTTGGSNAVASSSRSAIYGMGILPSGSMNLPAMMPSGSQTLDPNAAFFSAHQGNNYDDFMSNALRSSYNSLNTTPYPFAANVFTQATLPPPTEDDTSLTEEGSRKKKLKKMHASDQYVCVTCGRTDSPEWRKGPQGPKTLCNACGLRWAKSIRRDDTNDGGEGSSKQGNAGTCAA